ncbi:hypothetical protein [Nocardia ignorata]|uniref:hypothetical protein n=1 Tax=Nocardia ignorata TaxID=145285 RepID=UPI00082ECB19|nr:hypothetical protein [Nocardia ignorata]
MGNETNDTVEHPFGAVDRTEIVVSWIELRAGQPPISERLIMSRDKSVAVDKYMREFERDLGPLSAEQRNMITRKLLDIVMLADHIERKEAGLPTRPMLRR